MDSGTYQNVRRVNHPLSPASASSTPSANSSYKTNINRTKTRKWVEAKTQSYDGDDWGNDYDDEYDEPEEPQPQPPPPRVTNYRQPSRIAQQVASPRIVSQPAATQQQHMSASAGSRSPSGPPSLSLQTQPISSTANPTFPPQLAAAPASVTSTDPQQSSAPPARPEYYSLASPSAQANMSPGSQSAGPGQSTQRFPPRKSSMGQQDRPLMGGTAQMSIGARPDSSSSNRPWMDQQSGSPAQAAATSPRLVRPADIYRRMSEDKERERLSIDSGRRPSMDSVPGRNEASSHAPRSSTEQRRRTSFDSHDGSESARALRTTLEPVAERKSEYGMERLLANEQAGSLPGSTSQGPAASSPHSTGPLLPSLNRMSGFGEGFFSPSSSSIPQKSAPSESQTQHADEGPAQPEGASPPSVLEGPKLGPNPNIIMPTVDGRSKTVESGKPGTEQTTPARPSLPGAWVSESTTVRSELATPMEKPESSAPTPLSRMEPAGTPVATSNAIQPADPQPTTEVKHLPSSNDVAEAVAARGGSFDTAAGKHDDTIASRVVASGPGYHPTPQSLPPLRTANAMATDTPRSGNTGPSTGGSDIPPVMPLNPQHSALEKAPTPSFTSPVRQPTMSTIGTASPEKESDKLREEIMKSLGPNSSTPSSSGLQQTRDQAESQPGELSRESTNLSDVYGDYLAALEQTSSPVQATQPQLSGTTGTDSGPVIQPLSTRSSELKMAAHSRRFSWEQGLEDGAPVPQYEKPASPMLAQTTQASSSETPNPPEPANTTTAAVTGTLQPQPNDSGALSHPVSQVSSRGPDEGGPDEGGLTVLEPPSPISFVGDIDLGDLAAASPTAASRLSQLSLADEKQKVLIDDMHPLSPQDAEHPALSAGPSETADPTPPAAPQDVVTQATQQAKIMPFREILNIGATDLRIQRFDETRSQFFAMDSGLSEWLLHAENELEENGDGADFGDLSNMAQHSPTGVARPALNASNPNLPGTRGRASSGTMQHGLSGQTASAKSKELLHVAGVFGNKGMKSGMKLFNKGKNKLKERTGEKSFF
ncbi:hypothetical protein F4780DRAFT_394707 [Xylariomycetidae sp. FL0641]|nr:hypothetical protein F4780DRAFT_394707 [Xylariomycetidae sp. FL0641]